MPLAIAWLACECRIQCELAFANRSAPFGSPRPRSTSAQSVKKRFDLIVESRRSNPFKRVEQRARVEPRRALCSIAGLAEHKRPLVADALRGRIEPPLSKNE